MKTRQQIADWSTINLAELRKLPTCQLPTTYHLQADAGNGCAGDPPGFPTYFTRSVYTADGNNPHRGASMVIAHDGNLYVIEKSEWAETWEEHKAKQDSLMLRLWKPLPLDHPRTQAWIRATFAHHRHCYQVPELRAQGKNWSDAMLIWPGGTLGATPYGALRDVAFEINQARKDRDYDRWTEAHKAAFIKEIEQSNAHIKVACEVAAVPDNHDGTIIVRRYYPDFNPTSELIAGPASPGNWWEVMSQQPTPDRCPGQYGNPHPVNGSWCQMCGWHEERKAA